EVVTREELKRELWNDTVVDFEHGINTGVRRLREVLGDSAETPRFIETLPRRGYRFIYPTRPQATAIRIPEPPVLPAPRTAPRRWATPASVAAIAVIIAAAILLYMWRAQLDGIPRISSLAVLPLTNVSGDPNQD